MVILRVGGVDQSAKVRYGSLTAKLNTVDVTLKNPIPYYALAVAEDSPLVYWRLDEKTGLVAADSSGNGYNGVISGTGVLLRQAGATADGDRAMDFPNTNDYVHAAPPAFGALAPFSVELWVNFHGAGNRLLGLLTGNATLLGSGTTGFSFRVHAAVDVTITSGAVTSVGQWAHVVGTYDGTNARLYVNGVLAAGPTAVASLATGGLFFLNTDNATNPANALLDEAAIYNYTLTQAQITKHYSAGIGTLFDANAMPQIGDAVSLDWYADLIAARLPKGYWRLNDLGSSAADSSPYGNPGPLTGGFTERVAGATTDGDQAILFNGTSGVATVPHAVLDPSANKPFSMEVWVKPVALNSTTQRLVGMENGSNHGIFLFIGTDNKFRVLRGDAAAGFDQPPHSTILPVVGKWFHVVGTYDGSNLTIWVNGVQGSQLVSSRLADSGVAAFTIGKTANGTNAGCSLDEVAVYDRALTGAEILQNYQTGLAVFPWSGVVNGVESGDPVERIGTVEVKVNATNAVVAAASVAPFNMSDVPDRVTTFPYTQLKVNRQANQDGTFSIKGTFRMQQAGLLPGMTFQLWSSNQGYSGDSFTVTNVQATWPTKNNPAIDVTFGDPIVTMSAWVASAAQDAVLPITETKITDGAVSTPKLAAGSVTADKLTATLILATLIRAGAGTQHVEIDPNGVRAYDAAGNIVVNIPDDGSPVTVNANLIAKTLQAVGNAVFNGPLNELALGATLQLDAALLNPQQAPALVASWDGVTLPIDATYDPSSSSYKRVGLDYDAAGGAGGATKVFWSATKKNTGTHEYLLELLASDRTVNRSIDLGVGGSSGVTPLSVARLGGFIYVLLKDQTAPGGNANLGQTGSASFSYVIGLSGGPNEWAMGPYTMPEHGTLVSITVDSGADSGTVDSWAELWDGAGNFLAQSGKVTLGVGHGPHTYTMPADDLPAGSTYYIGVFHANSAAKRVGVQNGGTLHYKQNQASVSNFTGTTAWSTPPAGNMQAYLTYTKFNTAYKVRRYSQSTLALDVDFGAVALPISPGVSPVMCSDGTNLYIVDKASGTGTIKWSKYDTTLTQLSTVDTTYSSGSGDVVGAAAAGNEDFGAFRISCVTVNGIETFDATGGRQPNEKFPYSSAGNRATGLTFGDALGDGARFWSLPGTDAGSAAVLLTKHSLWTWLAEPSLYWVGYTWYDDNATGGLHETGLSPRASITLGRRQQLVMTAPAIPGLGGPDDPSKVRFYMLPNLTDPGATSLALQVSQATSTYTAVTYVDDNLGLENGVDELLLEDGSGGLQVGDTVDPSSNNFPAGTPAEIVSQTGNLILRGDGWATVPVQFGAVVLAADAATVTFSALPQTFRSLSGSFRVRNSSAASQPFDVQMNGDTTSAYRWIQTFSPTSGAADTNSGSTAATSGVIGAAPGTNVAGLTAWGSGTWRLLHYTDATTFKPITCLSWRDDANGVGAMVNGMEWFNAVTAAVTSLTFLMGAGNILAGSIITMSGENG